MCQPTEATIGEEEDELFYFPHMAETLDNVHRFQMCAKPKPLKSCLKTVNIDLAPKGCSLASTICIIFLCQKKFSCKGPTGSPKYVHCRLAADDPI